MHVVGDAAGAAGMVGGQAIDLQAAGQVPGHAPDARRRRPPRDARAQDRRAHPRVRRSAARSWRAPTTSWSTALDQYAADVGLAFQIVDDILDVEGDAASLGKTAGKDAAGAKPTYPALFGLDRSRALAAECLSRAHQTLATAKLTDGHLGAIAEWVVARKS